MGATAHRDPAAALQRVIVSLRSDAKQRHIAAAAKRSSRADSFAPIRPPVAPRVHIMRRTHARARALSQSKELHLSEPAPAAPPPDEQPEADHDREDRDDRDGFNFARVLRVAVIVAALVSAFAAAHGLVTTAGHYLKEIPAGTITRVDSARGGYRVMFDTGAAAHVPVDILDTTGRRIALRPGMPLAKRIGSLTYSIGGEPRGGLLWALRQWLLPARVTLPLVVYFVLSWLLVFRATEHRRHIAVEALIVPLVRWLAILAALIAAMALISGCAAVLFRMSG
jgi:hypothetical protein